MDAWKHRHDLQRQPMVYKEHVPADPLKRYIRCFWELRHDYSKEPFADGERIWPDGHFELIFSYGENYWQKVGKDWKILPQDFLIGQFDSELLLRSDGVTGLYGVRFHAWGLYPFLKKPMSLYARQLTAISAADSAIFGALKKYLKRTHKESGIAALQDFFIKQKGRLDHSSPVESIAQRIVETKGLVQIGHLAQTHKISNRTLQRLFNSEIGISAKLFAKIMRFNHAKELLETDPHINLAELAYTSGFADQSHFIRNFKSLYGITPRKFRDRVLELQSFFQDQD